MRRHPELYRADALGPTIGGGLLDPEDLDALDAAVRSRFSTDVLTARHEVLWPTVTVRRYVGQTRDHLDGWRLRAWVVRNPGGGAT